MSFYSSRDAKPLRCVGTVPQECPRCALNSRVPDHLMCGDRGSGCCLDSWGTLRLFSGFCTERFRGLFSSGPLSSRLLRSSRASGSPPSPRHWQSSCESQWKIGTFVQVFRIFVSFKALHNWSWATELNIETNINSLIILCSEMCSLIMTVKLFEAGNESVCTRNGDLH